MDKVKRLVRSRLHLNRAIFVFTIIGLLISLYLAYEYTIGASINCPIAGGGCDTVRLSQYSHIFGISVPFYGIAFYLAFLIVSLLATQSQRMLHKMRLPIFGLASIGLIASGYFFYLEAYVIHAYCLYCVLSGICCILLFTFAATYFFSNETSSSL